ncbi:MAG: Verru_Chthon cassette protein B [Terrimicrobiaceae bacterium]|nr:Verru_Chthon cassette protein B [Terrimicrobiaceae bacterium]
MFPPVQQNRPISGAFSLVEVILAIGLVTFALLVIFSLMPAGLASLQESSRRIVETEIFQTVGAELESTPFGSLTNYVTTRFPMYFDNEGLETTASNAIFFVRCRLADHVPATTELQRATVTIGYQRDPDDSGASVSRVNRRTFLVVNRGS